LISLMLSIKGIPYADEAIKRIREFRGWVRVR
jgi:hypothetical protein